MVSQSNMSPAQAATSKKKKQTVSLFLAYRIGPAASDLRVILHRRGLYNWQDTETIGGPRLESWPNSLQSTVNGDRFSDEDDLGALAREIDEELGLPAALRDKILAGTKPLGEAKANGRELHYYWAILDDWSVMTISPAQATLLPVSVKDLKKISVLSSESKFEVSDWKMHSDTLAMLNKFFLTTFF